MRPRPLELCRRLPITSVMSLEETLTRVSAIRQALADPAALIEGAGRLAGGVEAPAATGGESSFAAALQRASGGYEGAGEGAVGTVEAQLEDPSDVGAGAPGITGAGLADAAYASPASPYGYAAAGLGAPAVSSLDGDAQDSLGQRIVAIAESQLGQSEQPPGSNESPAISQYRTATAGAEPGAPWCAYFASWVARQAGEPIGEGGQGAGAVSEVWSWARSAGRAILNGPGVVPKPGDLIVFGDEHVGIVRDVLPDGQVQTIEGNYENKVAANVRTPSEATGYVEMS
ncbi:MAG TPA: CHAP domain-containing protein [Solirubrobacteraceae bacterium]|nr:CHAP domain-containing protein [Solirubrobacteraceae bacterium]